MKTVLILGAGVTRSTKPRVPVKRRPPLDADFFSIAKAVNQSQTERVIQCLRSLVGDYSSTLCQSLETATTYLYIKAIDSDTNSPYHRGFLQLLSLLNEVLAKTTNDIAVSPRSLIYRFLLSELRQLESPSNLSVITFNYDLLVERTFESIAQHRDDDVFAFPGCYRLEDVNRTPRVAHSPQFESDTFDHEGVAIYKLHGSMNWQSTHTSSTPTPNALLNPSRRLHVLDSPVIPTRLSWRRGRRTVHMKPILVPPVSGKRGMIHSRVVPLWSKAAAALRDADRIVIAGYSCPPLDLEARILLSENLRANKNKRVYLVDPYVGHAAKFIELCGVDHITAYCSVKDWTGDAR